VRRWFSVALVVALAAPAQAGELEVNWPVDMTVTGVGALVYILTETAFKKQLGPDECRWCDEPLNGLDREVREGLRWESTRTADYISNVTGFMLAPASALGLLGIIAEVDGKRANWPADGLVVVESAVVASAITQLVKMTAARERPFVHFAASSDPRSRPSRTTCRSSPATPRCRFSLAVASGTVASIRGYRAAPLVWATGLTVAATTGYLRIAADRHYFTDVLTGAAVGAAVGFSVPYFFHRGDTQIAVTPSSISVVGRW
jgi:membrane-associated phospholipid phosphatase